MTKTAWISWVPSNSPPCILFFCHKIGWNFFVLWSSIWVFMSHCQRLDFVFVYLYVEGLLISPPLFLVLLPELWAHKICRLWPVCVIEVMLVVLAESAQFMVALRQQSVPWIFHMWNKWVRWKMRAHRAQKHLVDAHTLRWRFIWWRLLLPTELSSTGCPRKNTLIKFLD